MEVALRNLAYNFTTFNKAVIQGNHSKQSSRVQDHKRMLNTAEILRKLKEMGRFPKDTISYWNTRQWNSRHTCQERNPEPHVRRKMEEVKKTWDHGNTINNQAVAKGKQWEKADELAKQMKLKGRKEAVADVRTWHITSTDWECTCSVLTLTSNTCYTAHNWSMRLKTNWTSSAYTGRLEGKWHCQHLPFDK